MLSKIQCNEAKDKTLEYFKKARIILTAEEMEKVEVADFGLKELARAGYFYR